MTTTTEAPIEVKAKPKKKRKPDHIRVISKGRTKAELLLTFGKGDKREIITRHAKRTPAGKWRDNLGNEYTELLS